MPSSFDRGRKEVATDSVQLDYDRKARDLAADLLVDDSSAIGSTSATHVRPILPQLDLEPGADQDDTEGWNGDDPSWEQSTAGTTNVGDELEMYVLDKDERMDSKTAVIYGVRNLNAGAITDYFTQIIVRDGSGGMIERYDISSLDVADNTDYVLTFENPIALREDRTISIEFVSSGGDLSASQTNIQLIGAVAESSGNELVDSDRFVTEQSSGSTMMKTYDRGLRVVAIPGDINTWQRAARDLAASMLAADSANINDVSGAHARNLLPEVDLNQGADNSAWNGDDPVWVQTTAGSAGDTTTVYHFDSSDRLDNKTGVIYGVRDLGAGGISEDVQQIILRDSTGAKVEQYDISQLDVEDETDYAVLFENPIALREDKSLFVEFVAGGGGSDVNLQLLGAIAESSGNELQESDRFRTDQESEVA